MLNISKDIDQKIELAVKIKESGTKLIYALRRVSAARDISRGPRGALKLVDKEEYEERVVTWHLPPKDLWGSFA